MMMTMYISNENLTIFDEVMKNGSVLFGRFLVA